MATFNGTSGPDNLVGSLNGDIFNLQAGGDDQATGRAGDDKFYLGASFTAADTINGGAGFDELRLEGDYSQALHFGATSLVGVEYIIFASGFDYNLVLADESTTPGQFFNVYGDPGEGHRLKVDASAETDTGIFFGDGAGDDVLTGGALGDDFTMYYGGHDRLRGGLGDDRFHFGGTLDSGERIRGGGGYDIIDITGDYAEPLVLGGKTMTGVETLRIVGASQGLTIILGDAVTKAGDDMDIDAFGLTGVIVDDTMTGGGFNFDGSGESDARLRIIGGQGASTIVGGAQDDRIYSGDADDVLTGGRGNDIIQAGGGSNTFIYRSILDSGVGFSDSILIEGEDTIDLSAIDANTAKGGNQAFRLVEAFGGHKGELVVTDIGAGEYRVAMDVNGDRVADSEIQVQLFSNAYEFPDLIL